MIFVGGQVFGSSSKQKVNEGGGSPNNQQIHLAIKWNF